MDNHIEALEKIRKTGKTNIFDSNAVVKLMIDMGYDTAYYLTNEKGKVDKKKYLELLKAM